MPSPGKKRTPLMGNTSQWQLLVAFSLSKFLCDNFQKLLALYTKEIVGSFAQ